MVFWIRILQTMLRIQMIVIQIIIITSFTHLTLIHTIPIPVLILMIIGPLVLIHIIIGYTILIHLITGLLIHRLIHGMIVPMVTILFGMQNLASLPTKDIYFLMPFPRPTLMMMNSLIPYIETT